MDRRKQYKHRSKAPDAKSIRELRRKQQAATRKEKRERLLSSKRVRHEEDVGDGEEEITVDEVEDAARRIQKKSEDHHALLLLLRKGFAHGTALIDAFLGVDGAMSSLVGFLSGTDSDLQMDATWCLTNMAAGDDPHAEAVLKHAAPYLITFLSGSNIPLQDQSAWALGNVAADSQTCRDTLRAQGIVEPLTKLIQSETSSVVKSAAFAMSNLARGDHANTRDLVAAGIVPLLAAHLVYSGKDKRKELYEVAWVITYITASGEHEEELVKAEVPQKLVSTAVTATEQDPDNLKVITPLMRSIGNLFSGHYIKCEALIEHEGLISAIGRLLQSEPRHIRKECLWVLSNMTSSEEICREVMEKKLIPPIVATLSSAYDIKVEASHCVLNLACHGDDLCQELVKEGAIQNMIPLMKPSDFETSHMALCFVEMALRTTPNGKEIFEENGGLTGLEGLEYHSNEELRAEANDLLERYFYNEDEEEEAKEQVDMEDPQE